MEQPELQGKKYKITNTQKPCFFFAGNVLCPARHGATCVTALGSVQCFEFSSFLSHGCDVNII